MQATWPGGEGGARARVFQNTLARVAETPRMTGGGEEGVRPLGWERRSRPSRMAGRPMLWHSCEWAGGPGEEGTGGAPEDEDGAAERFSPDGPIRLTDGSGAAANGAVAA